MNAVCVEYRDISIDIHINMSSYAGLTSMRDHAQVRPDDPHVYPVLLVSEDHRPPQTPRSVALLAARTLRTGHRSVV